jgi:hypothetical protein
MRSHRSPVALALGLALALLVASGCTEDQRAEQDGQDAGQALCDVRDAEGQDAVDEARAEFERQLDDLSEKFSSFTAEDRADIRENLADLVEHVIEGNEALIQQDLAVIRRNVDAVGGDVDDTADAAAAGFLQGLDDCL